jgi:hypothetical protein
MVIGESRFMPSELHSTLDLQDTVRPANGVRLVLFNLITTIIQRFRLLVFLLEFGLE